MNYNACCCVSIRFTTHIQILFLIFHSRAFLKPFNVRNIIRLPILNAAIPPPPLPFISFVAVPNDFPNARTVMMNVTSHEKNNNPSFLHFPLSIVCVFPLSCARIIYDFLRYASTFFWRRQHFFRFHCHIAALFLFVGVLFFLEKKV